MPQLLFRYPISIEASWLKCLYPNKPTPLSSHERKILQYWLYCYWFDCIKLSLSCYSFPPSQNKNVYTLHCWKATRYFKKVHYLPHRPPCPYLFVLDWVLFACHTYKLFYHKLTFVIVLITLKRKQFTIVSSVDHISLHNKITFLHKKYHRIN